MVQVYYQTNVACFSRRFERPGHTQTGVVVSQRNQTHVLSSYNSWIEQSLQTVDLYIAYRFNRRLCAISDVHWNILALSTTSRAKAVHCMVIAVMVTNSKGGKRCAHPNFLHLEPSGSLYSE